MYFSIFDFEYNEFKLNLLIILTDLNIDSNLINF